jgi:DNA-directed RNA polymerase subunit beta
VENMALNILYEQINSWVFEPDYSGKSQVFHGGTGNPFEQHAIVGKPYNLKLIHQVDDNLHIIQPL